MILFGCYFSEETQERGIMPKAPLNDSIVAASPRIEDIKVFYAMCKSISG